MRRRQPSHRRIADHVIPSIVGATDAVVIDPAIAHLRNDLVVIGRAL